MAPTIEMGDNVMTDIRAYGHHAPQYGDVMVLYRDRTYFIKRIVAMGGDTIEGKNGGIFLNGNLLNESYIEHSRAGLDINWEALGTDPMQNFGPLTVPQDKYFVLGDNRDVSLDSRSPEIGMFDRNSVFAKVLYVYRPGRVGARIR